MRQIHIPFDRPVSALDLYLNPSRLPQRVSTPTCPGSKTYISLFQCPHDCFTDTDVTEDTIEEMDEDDLDSLNKLVRQGLNIGTDQSSYRQVKFIIIEERKDPLQLAIFAIFLLLFV